MMELCKSLDVGSVIHARIAKEAVSTLRAMPATVTRTADPALFPRITDGVAIAFEDVGRAAAEAAYVEVPFSVDDGVRDDTAEAEDQAELLDNVDVVELAA